MTFGQNLQTLRRQNGLSQQQLAEQLGVSRQAVSKWELDAAKPDIDNVIQINASIDQFSINWNNIVVFISLISDDITDICKSRKNTCSIGISQSSFYT